MVKEYPLLNHPMSFSMWSGWNAAPGSWIIKKCEIYPPLKREVTVKLEKCKKQIDELQGKILVLNCSSVTFGVEGPPCRQAE